jgi:hypothetical protein
MLVNESVFGPGFVKAYDPAHMPILASVAETVHEAGSTDIAHFTYPDTEETGDWNMVT